MRYLLRKFLLFIEGIIATVNIMVKYSITNPAQIIAPIGVMICSVLMMTIANDTIFEPILMAIQVVLISFQFHGTYLSIKKSNSRRTKEDKERLQGFFESASIGGIYGARSILFLSIYKDSWLRAWYYRLRGVTRLSLYRYGDTDDVGSHTKFQVNAKELFHLQLKGCIDTEDPDKAVEGLNFVAKHYLTK